jgi:hypothetical protein
MEKEIAGEQGGDLGRVFRSLATGNRDTSLNLDIGLAKKEAQELYDVSSLFFFVCIHTRKTEYRGNVYFVNFC